MKHERTVCVITIIFWLLLLNMLYATEFPELQLQRRHHREQTYTQAKNSNSAAVVSNADEIPIVTKALPDIAPKAPTDPTETPSDTPPTTTTTTITTSANISTTLPQHDNYENHTNRGSKT